MNSTSSRIFQRALAELSAVFASLPGGMTPATHPALATLGTAFIQEVGVLLAPHHVEQAPAMLEAASQRLLYGMLAFLQLHGGTGEAMEGVERTVRGYLGRVRSLVRGRKKVAILTITAGNGHKAAAYAVEAGLHEYFGGDYIVTVHDIQADIGAIYESAVKHSASVYNWFFEGTNSTENSQILHTIGYPMFAKKLDTIFYEERPDLVVSTFSFPGIHHWIKKTLRLADHYIPFVTVITDSISIHYLWYAEGTDAYIVANTETRDIMEKNGVPRDRMVVLGFPVHPKFYRTIDVAAERRKEGLATDKPLFLVSVGTGGSMKDVDFLGDFARELGEEAQCVVILGRNTDLLERLQKKRFGPSVKLLGWVGDMDRWMKMADVMVTKAGGATVMECVAVELPMLITRSLAWQESGNAELVETYNIGSVLPDRDGILTAMRDYVRHPEIIREQRKNFAKLEAREATRKVANFLREKIGD